MLDCSEMQIQLQSMKKCAVIFPLLRVGGLEMLCDEHAHQCDPPGKRGPKNLCEGSGLSPGRALGFRISHIRKRERS